MKTPQGTHEAAMQVGGGCTCSNGVWLSVASHRHIKQVQQLASMVRCKKLQIFKLTCHLPGMQQCAVWVMFGAFAMNGHNALQHALSSPHSSGMLLGLREAVKDPLAAVLRRAAAAKRQAAAAEHAVATVTAGRIALAQHNKQFVQQRPMLPGLRLSST